MKKEKKWKWLDKDANIIPFKETDDQRSLQSDWKQDTPGCTQPKVVVLDAPSFDDLLHTKKGINPLFSEILLIKESCNLIEQATHLATPIQIWW